MIAIKGGRGGTARKHPYRSRRRYKLSPVKQGRARDIWRRLSSFNFHATHPFPLTYVYVASEPHLHLALMVRWNDFSEATHTPHHRLRGIEPHMNDSETYIIL